MAERNAIAIAIKLLGGKEMVEQLKGLGESGEKAIEKINEASKNTNLTGIGHDLSLLAGDFATFATRAVIGLTALKVVADGVVVALFELAKSSAESADEAGKAAQAAGLSAKAYQEWAFAAESVGVSQTAMSTALNTFNKQVTKTADETTKAGKAGAQMGRDIQQGVGFTVETFKDLNVEVTRFGETVKGGGDKAKAGAAKAKTGFDELGISVKNSDGTLKTNEQLLLAVANAFQKMPDGARKSQIALKLFGLEGAKLIPLLDQGAAGIDEFNKKFAELGIGFSDEQIASAARFNDALLELKSAAGGVLKQLGLIFVPSFTTAANSFRDVILRNKAAILDFANNALAKAKVLIADFFAALAGRDADVSAGGKWIVEWRDAIVGFASDVTHVVSGVVIPAFETLRKAAGLVTDAINKVFGTNVSGGELLIIASITQVLGGFQLIRTAVFTAINAISLFSRALVANPWLLAITAVAAGIALWATRTDGVTAAMEAHQKIVDEVKAAYDRVGGAAKNWSDIIEHTTRDQALADFKNVTAAAAEARKALEDLSVGTGVAHLTGDDLKVAETLRDLSKQFEATGGDVDEFKKKVQSIADSSSSEAVKEFALEILNVADNLRPTEQAVGQASDLVTIFTGNTKDAQAAIEHLTGKTKDSFKPLVDSTKDANAAVDETKGKVEALGQTITVFRGGGSGGQLSKEVFDVVDGVARRADQSKAALDGVAASAKTAVDNVKNVSGEVTNAIGAVPDAIKPDAAGAAVDGIVTDVGKIAPAAQEAADGTNTALATIDAGSAAQAADAVVTPFESLPGKISAILSGLQGLIQGGFATLSATVTSLASQINAQIQRILSALREAAAAAANLRAQAASGSSSDSGGSHGGFAGGGDVRGAGTGTSDSILAWLSNGEFVNRAAAVAYYGRDIFHALNNMTLPKGLLRGLRGFNLGGAVDTFSRSMTIPRLAGGGAIAVSASAPDASAGTMRVKLDFGLGPADIFDMVTDTFTANRFQQFALKEANSSAGRAPSRGK